MVNDVLYMSTGFGHVVALNAETGEKIWDIDSPHPPAMRGVSYWPGTKGYGPEIVYGTMDGWLIALDAKTGKLISRFRRWGHGGLENRAGSKPGLSNVERKVAAGHLQELRDPRLFPGRAAGIWRPLRCASVRHADRKAGMDIPYSSSAR